jgi:hypothetical protein
MKRSTAGWLAVLVALGSTGSMLAHHSLTNFDTTKAVHVKGTIVQFHQINPHSFIYLEQKGTDGQTIRWAIEGPSVLQLSRTGFAKDALKYGDVVEICGYVPKETIMWQIASPTGATSLAGRLINGEVLVMPDGKQRSWGDYGVHKCFESGYTDQHSK